MKVINVKTDFILVFSFILFIDTYDVDFYAYNYRHPLMIWKASPIGVNEWGNPNSAYVIRTNCYTHIASVGSKQRGDIIAFPNHDGSGHVGIVFDGNLYISARDKTVDEKQISSGKPTAVWRYNYMYNKQ